MIPIVIFYHCLFFRGYSPPEFLPDAALVIDEQMRALKDSGLEDAASEIYIGVNGGAESKPAAAVVFPEKSKVTYHGLQCRNELRTLLLMEDYCRSRKGEAHVLYFHAKGATHAADSDYAIRMATPWRRRMMKHCIGQWRMCVAHLQKYEAVGCHWLTGQGHDHSQHYFAGTFYWVRSSFFRTIPSLMTRARIKTSGLDSLESRFEAEVHLGNGPRLPRVKNYYAGSIGT